MKKNVINGTVCVASGESSTIEDKELEKRIWDINRTGDMDTLTGVFYSLSEQRISVGKATQTVRNYLLTGTLEEFEPPQGFDKYEKIGAEKQQEITLYRAALRKIQDHLRAGNDPQAVIDWINRWHVNTPDAAEV